MLSASASLIFYINQKMCIATRHSMAIAITEKKTNPFYKCSSIDFDAAHEKSSAKKEQLCTHYARFGKIIISIANLKLCFNCIQLNSFHLYIDT